MYSYKEKKIHFTALRNAEVADIDLNLLKIKMPSFSNISMFSRDPKRYSDDILYSLLDVTTREEIRAYRREVQCELDKSENPEGNEETSDVVDKPSTEGGEERTEKTEEKSTVSEARVEEAEARAEEAEERAEEAEERAEEAETALEEEKKKEHPKEQVAQEKSKKVRSTQKSTGTTSSIRKSN